MSIVRALALLGAGASGYVKGLQNHQDQQRQDEEDAFRREMRDRQRIDWKRQDEQYNRDQAEQAAVRQAAMPTTVEDTPVAMPIGSRDEPRAPEDQGIRAAGKTFADRASAESAAADYNAAPSRIRRAAAAMSDPGRAGQMEASAQTVETGAMQLRAAKLKEADDAYNRELIASVTDFPTLERFVNDTKGDGRGGDLKITIQPSADGKTVQVLKLNPDGTTAATPFSFQNNTDGVQQAVGIIGMKLSPADKLAHLHAAAKTEEDRRRWELDFGLKKTDSETRGKREDRMAKAAERHADAAERTASIAAAKAANSATPQGINMADADKFINTLFTRKDDTTGATTFDPKGADAVRSLVLHMPAAQAGDTQGAVNQSLMVYNRYMLMAKGDHDKAMQFMQQALAPPTAPAPAPANAPTKPRPAPAPVSAAPAGPMSRTVADPMAAQLARESSELNQGKRTDFSPEVKQYIEQKRAAEAAARELANAAAKEAERVRAVAASKAQLGR